MYVYVYLYVYVHVYIAMLVEARNVLARSFNPALVAHRSQWIQPKLHVGEG